VEGQHGFALLALAVEHDGVEADVCCVHIHFDESKPFQASQGAANRDGCDAELICKCVLTGNAVRMF